MDLLDSVVHVIIYAAGFLVGVPAITMIIDRLIKPSPVNAQLTDVLRMLEENQKLLEQMHLENGRLMERLTIHQADLVANQRLILQLLELSVNRKI